MAKLGNRPQTPPVRRAEPLPKPEKMPDHPLGHPDWHPYVKRYWDTVWESDARYYWEESDLLLLDRCLLMVEQIAMGDATTATFSELRRTEEALYLSPGSRQRSRISTAPSAGGTSAAHLDQDALERRRREREAMLREE